MSKVDLHLHTTYSDGNLSPAELVALCVNKGLEVISVTDHDSTEGVAEAVLSAQRISRITVIPGIELSSDVPSYEVHLLGYFVTCEDLVFQDKLRHMRLGRQERVKEMVEKLRSMGVNISWGRVQELGGHGAIGRPHIAQAMVEAGYVKHLQDAFEVYLGRTGLAYVERNKLTPQNAIAMLVSNGALPVIAHPLYSVNSSDPEWPTELRVALRELKECGLVGMEVYYKNHTPEQVQLLSGLADELGLIRCGGSDYHASGDISEVEPGQVGPPLDAVTRLQAIAG